MKGYAQRRLGKPAVSRGRRTELTHQAQKSAQTRTALVEAAVRCLIKYGYSGATMPRIAAEAGLSRGAMMHHFENALAVIRAAIQHLHEKRLRAFERAIGAMPGAEDHLPSAVRAYWGHVTHPLFAAFHELAVAARTNPELDAILKPARAEFNRRWYALAVELFPEWRKDRQSFDLALALSQTQLEGMAIARLSGGLDDATAERLLAYLEGQLKALRA